VDNSVAEQSQTLFKRGLAPWQEKRTKKLIRTPRADEDRRDCAGVQSIRSHLSRTFKANSGLSPLQWLTNNRLERAKELLRFGNSAVSDVALACGFRDQAHFTRVFNRQAWYRDAATVYRLTRHR
jgi:methylphosphotriester-DNA--protein-cysteine methyltransferase